MVVERQLTTCFGVEMVWRFAAILFFTLGWTATVHAAEPLTIHVAYMQQSYELPPTLSSLSALPEDLGLQGAVLAIKDNNTTGRFLKQKFKLHQYVTEVDGGIVASARQAYAEGIRLFVVNARSDDLLKLTRDAGFADAVFFNSGAPDVRLRSNDCRANTFHTLPSRAMLSDALTQFLIKRRWANWLLIEGPRPTDMAFAMAIRKSAKKFGAKIRLEKQWSFDTDLRRNAGAEVPLFTKGAEYDAVIVADETNDFGPYIAYNTWLPRPVAGTHGLRPTAWSHVIEQWGAAQLQKRFGKVAKRGMRAVDFAAWLAVRSIGEVVTRTGNPDPANVRQYLLSDAFSLAAFKGRKASFRTWNGQMRQPIPLVHPNAMVASAPLDGFLHRRTELDTLGLDKPETKCTNFGK